MAISLDDIPFDESTIHSDRWLFVLADELQGHHGGALFERGVTVEPVGTRQLRRFVCAFGNAVLGAKRVAGEPVELGDCEKLRPAKPAAPEPQAELEPQADDDATDMESPKAKRSGKR